MRLVYNCEDVLSLKLSRRLITMLKQREPGQGESARCAITDAGLEPAHASFPQKYFEPGAGAEQGRGGAGGSGCGEAEEEGRVHGGGSKKSKRKRGGGSGGGDRLDKLETGSEETGSDAPGASL